MKNSGIAMSDVRSRVPRVGFWQELIMELSPMLEDSSLRVAKTLDESRSPSG